jgi:predicted phage terminase large subunit-like protein
MATNVQLAAAIKDEAAREMARRSFADYLSYIDPKYDTMSPHICYLSNLLTRVECGEVEKLIITIAPRTGKSRLLSRFSSYWLGRNEGQSLLLLSASQSLSIRNSRWIRNDVLSERYPWDVSIDDQASSILAWRTSTENEVRAFSSGSVLMGQQGNLILADDLQAETMTAQTRDSLEQWLRSVLETRREPNSPLVILNNRWSTDDLVARLVEGPDGDSFEVVNIEAICTDPDADPLQRNEGESVWPSRWSVDLLEKKKKAVGSHVWESSYQGHPTPEGGRLINVSLFKDYESLPTAPVQPYDPARALFPEAYGVLDSAKANPRSQFVKVCGIDTSGVVSTTTTGSWSAWVTVLLDTRTGDIYITHCDRVRNVGFEELRQRVLTYLNMTGNIDLCVIENASQGGRLAESLRGMTKVPVQLVEAKRSKEDRVITILPLLEGGKIHIPKAASWRQTFLKELADFPAGRSSDIVDAWAYAVAYCKIAIARRDDDDLFEQQLRRLEGGWMFQS